MILINFFNIWFFGRIKKMNGLDHYLEPTSVKKKMLVVEFKPAT